MKKNLLLLFSLVLFIGEAFAVKDTVVIAKSEPRSKSTLTIRTHNVGYFSFTGRIISTNPALDFFYTYDRKQWGLSVFKAFDLYDHTTTNNFTLVMVRKTFRINNRLTVTPHLGTILEQANTFADKGSDIASIIITAYKISNHLTIDHTAIFGNLAFDTEERDWANRFRILYTSKHWDITALFWHNNKLIDHDNSEYLSTGLNVFYNRIKVSDLFAWGAGVSALKMCCSNVPSEYPKRDGIFFTVAGYIH